MRGGATIVLLVASGLLAGAATGDDAARAEGMRSAQLAYQQADEQALERLTAELFPKPSPDPAEQYDHAYLLWRRQLLIGGAKGSPSERRRLLDTAEEQLNEALASGQAGIEASILLSAITGSRADLGGFGAMLHGRRAYTLASANVEQTPDNPRAQLQLGIIRFFMPSMFGGGPEGALDPLEKSHRGFENGAASQPWPNWGALDAAAWLGQALAKLGRVEEARAVYQQALERQPDAAWIRNTLLPELGPVE